MKKYSNGNRIIFATDKAYKILYKEQGFKEVIEKDNEKETIVDKPETQKKETKKKKGE